MRPVPPEEPKTRRPAHQTQWAAQFAVASELCKQGYQVALTLGNHPTADLMVYSPSGNAFVIDVKGLYRRNFWAIRKKPEKADVYYVLTYVPTGMANRYFILTQAEVNEGIEMDFARARKAAVEKGRPVETAEVFPGVTWSYAEKFENAWDKLPR